MTRPYPVNTYADNPDSPVIRKQQRRARSMRRWVVAGVCGIGVTSILLGLSVTSGLLTPPPVPTVDSLDVNQSEGKPLAEHTLADWLHQDPAPVPGGRIASWDGVDITKSPADAAGVDVNAQDKKSDLPNYATELHYFTVLGDNDTIYQATVLVETNPDLGARVRTEPSLMRLAPAAPNGKGWGTEVTWYGYTTMTAPAPAVDAAGTWALAITGGDPKKLRQTVGDPDVTHAYMPVGKADPSTVTVEVVDTAHKTPPSKDTPADKSTVLMRVELRADLSGEPQPTDTNAAERPPMTYDVLVTGADTASPRIVSWGPAGTGPKLTEYSVAITGRDIAEDRDEPRANTDTTTTTETPTPEPIPSPTKP